MTAPCLAKADASAPGPSAEPAPAETQNAPSAGDAAFTGPPAVALAGSDVDKVGQVILASVAGRTLEQALASGAPRDNPFGLDANPLLFAAGVYFINGNDPSSPLGPSEFAINPDYVTPGARFAPSEKTPPIMPFAFNRGGTCHGGYVTGYPVPDKVYAVDMHGKTCSAKAVDDAVRALYDQFAEELPADNDAALAGGAGQTIFDGTSASDHDLEMIAYGAYAGAYGQAVKHGNFFTSDDLSYADLREAIRDALEKEGYGAALVLSAPVADARAAKSCAAKGAIELRVAFNSGGQGVSLVAVSDKRMAAYEYAPGDAAGLAILRPTDCLPPLGGEPDRLSTPEH
jgi:hypothetical protein